MGIITWLIDDPTVSTKFTIEKNRDKVQHIIDNMPILEKTDEVFEDKEVRRPKFHNQRQ